MDHKKESTEKDLMLPNKRYTKSDPTEDEITENVESGSNFLYLYFVMFTSKYQILKFVHNFNTK